MDAKTDVLLLSATGKDTKIMLENTFLRLYGHSASEVTTIRRYTNMCIITMTCRKSKAIYWSLLVDQSEFTSSLSDKNSKE